MSRESYFRIAFIVVVLGFWVVGRGMSPNQADRAFFEAASQIIPVLLLTLAVETQAFRLRWAQGQDEFLAVLNWLPEVMLVGILFSGELACVDQLANMGAGDVRDPSVVYATILAALTGLMFQFLFGVNRRAGARS